MKNVAAPKDLLFQTAARLFHQYGYRATGVDAIAAESGISKMTLYRHFPSKDDLILAFLQHSNAEFWAYFEGAVESASGGRAKLLAFFESLQSYTTGSACYGCPFINIAEEYPESRYPGHRAALDHKQAVRSRFTQLAAEAGASDPNSLADGLLLLMDGAYMAARMYGPATENPARNLAEVARGLIDLSLGISGA